MQFQDIICIGGVLDGKSVTRDDLTFQAQGYTSGPIRYDVKPTGAVNIAALETTVYEITALDIDGTTILFYKDMGEQTEMSLMRLMRGYRPAHGRY